jgi:hypothetical protein
VLGICVRRGARPYSFGHAFRRPRFDSQSLGISQDDRPERKCSIGTDARISRHAGVVEDRVDYDVALS